MGFDFHTILEQGWEGDSLADPIEPLQPEVDSLEQDGLNRDDSSMGLQDNAGLDEQALDSADGENLLKDYGKTVAELVLDPDPLLRLLDAPFDFPVFTIAGAVLPIATAGARLARHTNPNDTADTPSSSSSHGGPDDEH